MSGKGGQNPDFSQVSEIREILYPRKEQVQKGKLEDIEHELQNCYYFDKMSILWKKN